MRRELSRQAQSCLPGNCITCIDQLHARARLLAYLLLNVLRDVLCGKGVVRTAQNNRINAGFCLIFSAK